MSYLAEEPIVLPELVECDTEPVITQLTSSLGIPRNVLAEPNEIATVWPHLKPTLEKIKPQYRHELLARMVVAIRVGLFSSAVNEMWNTTILALRQKVKNFGYKEAASFLEKDINEEVIKELRDKDLIDFCVELGFITDDSYFFLNNCREIRNNYSSAHPSESMLDGMELNFFMHQCTKHVLGNDLQYVGFPVSDFLKLVKQGEIDSETMENLSEKIEKANDMQKTAILKVLFANYVDETTDEIVRTNCLELASRTWEAYSEVAMSEILALHSSYILKDKSKKQYSERFFEKVKSLDLLPKDELVSIMYKAIKDLENTHHAMDNFYNEEPFAERLATSFSKKVPKPLLRKYVYVVMLCYIGNSYGTSRSAEPYYEEMIKNFSLREVEQLFDILKENAPDNMIRYRLKHFKKCQIKFKELLKLLSEDSIPLKYKKAYENFTK
ncbi:hypothetical protein PQS34_03810 [Bacillus altitudinis]|uniref:hypothetical protein n=1 Tax=Bacillus altitudinis TaxID=293387 RepID=UPI00234D44EB|nr:hypothetical protein [Bacillus altitudinis]MBW3700776.1 hypothetical protein [Bacillus aerophilus]MDC7795225.1 hypothetical protein [Bacillus altitudinis]